MEKEILKLTYRNEDDKAYGLAGMILSLSSLHALPLIREVTMDTEGPMVHFTNDYYYITSPAVSPKAVWNKLRENFYITSSMVIGNVFARRIVRDGEDVTVAMLDNILSSMIEEGRDTCSLDEDETMVIYDNIVMRNRNIFGNRRLHPTVKKLQQILSLRRHLSISELNDELDALI